MKPVLGNGSNPFSAYLSFPNIVLLGDPGAGKTHLFNEFARFEQTQAFVARSFLNKDVESLQNVSTLYIDALDERRASREDGNTVDQIVQKLFLVKPSKVRIACRAADWLGETDLAAFRDFFEVNGDCVVLNLQSLSNLERVAVLTAQGVKDPEAFLAEAQERSVDNFLGNPQNLKMLAEVVEKRNWPSSRADLFQQATDILLTEHNSCHIHRPSGRYSASELRDAAGEVCAVRLISDIEAISLVERDHSVDVPNYRNLCAEDKDKVLAALGRRVFVSGTEVETVDYAHRTIAEYLGANWLAKQVGSGLPIGRIRALIGVDGRPTSELRWLHAWLAVLLPEHAQTLIDVDPFGVLSYGDGKVLTPALRQYLLHALATLADVDPWFRGGNWSSSAVAGLSGADMTEGFRSILSKQDANFSLRVLVLDALSAGPPVPELANDLQLLVANSMVSYAERSASVGVLLRLAKLGETLLAETYKTIGLTVEDLRLKAKILKRLVGKQLGVDALAELFRDILLCKAKVPFDVLYHLSENVPDSVVCTALDLIAEYVCKIPSDCIRDDVWGLDREFDSLLRRALELDLQIEGLQFLSWLEGRYKVTNGDWDRNTQSIQTIVAASPSTVMRAISAAIRNLGPDENAWTFLHHLCEIGLTSFSDPLFLKDLIPAVLSEQTPTKKTALYALALDVTLRIGTDARDQFEILYTYGEGEPELDAVRQVRCFNEIPEWREKEAQGIKERKIKQEETRLKNRADFCLDVVQIRDGSHRNWLGWIAQTYFGMLNDAGREPSPHARLVVELGEENSALAIEGLISLVTCGTMSDLTEIIEMHGENKHYRWWYAILAGLDEYVAAGHDVVDLDDTYLLSALTIDTLCTTFTFKDNVSTQYVHPWKSDLLQRRPDIVISAYTVLARADLAKSSEHIFGLHELLQEPALLQYRPATALALLQEFPNAHEYSLNRLIQVAMYECEAVQFLQILRESLLSEGLRDDTLTLWLAAGYLVSPSEFVAHCDALDPPFMVMLIWRLREFCGFSHRQQKNGTPLTCQQIEKILQWVVNVFPYTSPPEGVRMGDTNASDATDFALKLVALLSAHPTNEAAAALNRLSIEPSASSYLNDFKHAIAQQRVRMIDERKCSTNPRDSRLGFSQ